MDDIKKELVLRELARRHYSDYLAYAHGAGWIRTRMSTYIADHVQEFLEKDTGHAYDILVIETPPQHGKSMTVSESLPSWYLGKHPEDNVILASYNTEFAERFCRRNKEKIKFCGGNLFGISIGSIDRAAEFELDGHRGRLISRGLMSGITGNPANLIIIDDPVKNRQEADSPTYRNGVWEEWQASLKSRLCAGGKVILIMTPWHEDDLAARVLSTEPNSELLRLPVEAEEGDPLGRLPGSALCPELGKDEAWLQDFKASYIKDPKGGVRAWTSLYQCSPRVEEGNIIKREWWQFYDPNYVNRFATEIISVDASFKDSDTSDFVSIQVWGKIGNDYYLRYCRNSRLDFLATIEAIKSTKMNFPNAQLVLIEEAANGEAIMNVLQRERALFVVGVRPMGSKLSRVNAVSAAIESGHVFVPYPGCASWVNDFIDQFTAFPNGQHDDMVDACSQALNRLIYSSGEIFEEPLRNKRSFMEKIFNPYGI